MILCSCAKCFLINSITNFKNPILIPQTSFPYGKLFNTKNVTVILINRMKHQRQPLSKTKKTTIECKDKSARFSFFSIPNPWHAPRKSKFVRSNHSPFMNRELSKAVMKKKQLCNKFGKEKTQEYRRNYKKQQNYYVTLLRKATREYYGNLDKK